MTVSPLILTTLKMASRPSGVRPRNCPELVSELLDLTRLDATACVNIDTFGDVPLHQALTQRFEIARPSSDTLAFIAERTANPGLKQLLNPERKAYVFLVRGRLQVNGQTLQAGDAAMLQAESSLALSQGQDAEVLVFDLAA